MVKTGFVISFVAAAVLQAASFPEAEIGNRLIRVRLYLPDAAEGFYRGARFDWSGMIASLEYNGHEFYGPWFQRTDPAVRDFSYEGDDIVASPCTAATGPAEEFLTDNQALGYDDASPGGSFVKIGVGALRRPDAGRYDRFRLYEIADAGTWSVHASRDSVEFIQTLDNPASGYGYRYRKTVKLAADRPEMALEHSLQNTGQRSIRTRVYNHNFLTLDHQAVGPNLVITVPFQIVGNRPLDDSLAAIRGNRIVFLRTLSGKDRVATPMLGFGSSRADNDIRIEDIRTGAGVRMTSDHPLADLSLWSIRTALAVEPFIDLVVPPGKTVTWRIVYEYR